MTTETEKKDDLDDFARMLQEQINKQQEATFSKKVIKEYNNPQNIGRLKDPDAEAVVTGPCGDTMEIYLHIENGRVNEASFMTDGCGPSIACGSMFTRMICGRSLDDLENITEDDILKALDGLPDDHRHCATLILNTYKQAYKNYRERTRL